MARVWFIQSREGRQGPYSDDQLLQLAREGHVTAKTLVRREGDPTWIRASTVKGLFGPASPKQPEPSGSQTTVPPQSQSNLPPPLPGQRKSSSSPRTNRAAALFLSTRFWLGTAAVLLVLVGIAAIATIGIYTSHWITIGKVVQQAAGQVELPPIPSPAPQALPEKIATAKPDQRSPASADAPISPQIKEDPTRPADKSIARVPAPEMSKPPAKAEPPAPPPKFEPGKTFSSEQVVAMSEPSIAVVIGKWGTGSGFMVRKNLLATNRHVIAREFEENLKLVFPSRTDKLRGPHDVMISYVDPKRDLAFLSLAQDIPPLPLAQNYRFTRGQDIIAIGNPGAFATDISMLLNAVNKGVLSTESTLLDKQPYFQMGISLNHGNSGGPILLMTGQVVGVAAAGEVHQRGIEQISYCVPIGELETSIKACESQTPDQIKAGLKTHRNRVVYSVVHAAGKYYTTVLQVYRGVIEVAAKSRDSLSDALQTARDTIKTKYPPSPLADVSAIQRQLTASSTDSELPDDTRKTLIELLANLRQMKSYADGPRGTFQNVIDKSIELTDRHEKLIESLKLSFGIEDEE